MDDDTRKQRGYDIVEPLFAALEERPTDEERGAGRLRLVVLLVTIAATAAVVWFVA